MTTLSALFSNVTVLLKAADLLDIRSQDDVDRELLVPELKVKWLDPWQMCVVDHCLRIVYILVICITLRYVALLSLKYSC